MSTAIDLRLEPPIHRYPATFTSSLHLMGLVLQLFVIQFVFATHEPVLHYYMVVGFASFVEISEYLFAFALLLTRKQHF